MIQVDRRTPDGRVRSVSSDDLIATVRWRDDEAWLTLARLDADAEPPIDAHDAAALLQAGREAACHDGAAVVHWESDAEAAAVEPIASTAGLTGERQVLQLRRALPLEPSHLLAESPLTTRPLRPGTSDEQAWVTTNGRAFATHPDQGRVTLDALRATMAEPWFDPEGLRVVDADGPEGELAGFCWTKVHPASDTEPRLGEIYVIGVDPDHEGRGLGRALVLDGLERLAADAEVAMLYVEADNVAARRLYDSLGFTLHHVRHVRSAPCGELSP